LIVVSCHTACSHAFSLLQSKLPIPVIGVTEAGISSLQAATQTGRVAVLGTASTIASNTYQNALARFTVFPVACPLFVPLVEEGLHNSEAAFLIAEHYLGFLRTKNLDAALLACTHYPLLRTPIQAALGDAVRLIEPAKACAEQVRSTLASHGLLNTAPALPQYRFYASDDPEKFRRLASLFFPSPIESVELRRFS
jgi:glutamate racemase